MKHIKLFENFHGHAHRHHVHKTFDQFARFIILRFEALGSKTVYVPDIDKDNSTISIIVDNASTEVEAVSSLISNIENTKEYENYYIGTEYEDMQTTFIFKFIPSGFSYN